MIKITSIRYINCAARFMAGISSPLAKLVDNNLISTINCMEWCAKNKCRFIFLSTNRVYPIKPLNNLEYAEKETRLVG